MNTKYCCIQPTYEELKHLIANYEAAVGQRIQPTYEELKPDKAVTFERKSTVSSLPMRN